MPSSIAAAAASRCCNQMLLAKRFSSVLSLSLNSSSSSGKTATSTATKAAFSTTTASWNCRSDTSNSNSNSNSNIKISRPVIAIDTTTTMMSMINNNSINAFSSNNSNYIRRSMATSNRKVIDAKNARRLKIQQKKKKNSNTNNNKAAGANANEDDPTDGVDGSSSSNVAEETNKDNPFLQHQEWVKFQQSITVDGFQTGQTTTATVLKKSRGGKQARRKREKELLRLGGGAALGSNGEKISAVAAKFPAIRYSPEETDELLKQAYAALPPRAGKRGTRNLRRQATRWKIVRKIRSDYKAQLLRAHHRRMEERKYKRDRTKDALDASVEQRANDLDYQGAVLKRWMMETTNTNTKTETNVE